MTDIYDRLRQRVAFDYNATRVRFLDSNKRNMENWHWPTWAAAADVEYQSLAPLITALIAEVKRLREALEYYQETDNWPYATKGKCPGAAARNALAASDKALEEVLDGTKDL
jgi:hypothetical protein